MVDPDSEDVFVKETNLSQKNIDDYKFKCYICKEIKDTFYHIGKDVPYKALFLMICDDCWKNVAGEEFMFALPPNTSPDEQKGT